MNQKNNQHKLSPSQAAASLAFATKISEQTMPKAPQQAQEAQPDPNAGQQVNPLETQFQQFESKVTSELQQINQSIQQLLKNEQAEPPEA